MRHKILQALEQLSNLGLSIYPYNVAKKPQITDTNLNLVVVGECSIYKYYNKVIVNNASEFELKSNQLNFELLPIDSTYNIGQEECLKQIGSNSIYNLLN